MTNDGQWESLWDIYPRYATMTMVKQAHAYWFLYEGTPGGVLEPGTDFMYRSNGTKTMLSESWNGDIAAEEWAYFSDPNLGRSLYVVHHENDTANDLYWPMDNNMTVFGFGRSDSPLGGQISAVAQHFTVGMMDSTEFSQSAKTVNAAYRQLSITVGTGDVLGSPPSTTVPPSIRIQPASKTVTEGQTATFSVLATGTVPMSYQWKKNGVNISGANSADYTTPAAALADNGAAYRCVVSNSVGSVTSNAATLTVNPQVSNNQFIVIDRTFVHSTSYSAALLGETPSPTNPNCIFGNGIVNSGGGTDICNHEGFKFFQFQLSNPDNWSSPINYAQGTLYQRVEIIEKPSTTPARYAACFFQDQVVSERHACGDPAKIAFTGPGTYYSSQDMTTMYQYSTAVDWTRSPQVIMLHMTDENNHQPDSYPDFMGLWIGTPNWDLYYPTKLRYTAIIVPPGGGAPVWP